MARLVALLLLTACHVGRSTAALAMALTAANDHHDHQVHDIQSSGDSFTVESGVGADARLLLVEDGYALVGARDAVYNMSLSSFDGRTVIEWAADASSVKKCRQKGKTLAQCHNYIRLVARVDQGWLVCGTHAFDPSCRIYQQGADDYVTELSSFDGVGIVPYDGAAHSAHLTIGSHVYAGTTADFNGLQPLLHRRDTRTPEARGLLTGNAALEKTTFVGTIESRDHVYMVMREVSTDRSCSGNPSSPSPSPRARIARVCKADMGGAGNKNNRWTSFVKTRLNCSLPGEYPFYFDDVDSITSPIGGLYYGAEAASLVYVAFNTPYAGLRASAVCAFSMDDLAHVFVNSPFKGSRSRQPNERPSQCVANSKSLSEEALRFADSHDTLERQVPNFFDTPLIVHTSEANGRFTHIAVAAQVVAVGGARFDVLFVGTDNGRVLKVVNTVVARGQTSDRSRIVETLQVLPPGTPITGLTVHDGAQLAIVWSGGIRYVQVQRCSRGSASCSACTALRDPHCAWSVSSGACVSHSGDTWSRADVIQSVLTGASSACSAPTVVVNDVDGTTHTIAMHDATDVDLNLVLPMVDREAMRNIPERSVEATLCGDCGSHDSLTLASSTTLALFLGVVLGAVVALLCLKCNGHRRAKCSSPVQPSINTSHTSMWSSTSPRSPPALSRSNSRAVDGPIHAYTVATIGRPATRHMPSLPLEVERHLGNVTLDPMDLDDDDNGNYSTLPKDYKVKQMYL